MHMTISIVIMQLAASIFVAMHAMHGDSFK